MRWSALTEVGWRGEQHSSEELSKSRLLHLQIIGALSALIFAFNFCLEIFTLLSEGRNHQILILMMQLCLASWAILELILLHKSQPPAATRWLGVLLVIQFLLEAARLCLVISGQRIGVDKNFGILMVDLGPLAALIPLYLFVFFGIIKSLMAIHRQELEKAWEQLTRAVVAQSRQQEREQLLRDMHDGFGSQIATMRIMAEQGRLDPALIPQYLNQISADLHLIVDTFREAEAVTLSTALADLRYRMQQRIGTDNVRLHWKLDLLPEPHLNSRAILSVLRIIQEALSNALLHANPKNVWVEAKVVKPEAILRISIHDDGRGLPELVQKKRGLNNMETRARELGGQIQWIKHDPGSEVVITIQSESE
jgi:signal transduction histidine kinase